MTNLIQLVLIKNEEIQTEHTQAWICNYPIENGFFMHSIGEHRIRNIFPRVHYKIGGYNTEKFPFDLVEIYKEYSLVRHLLPKSIGTRAKHQIGYNCDDNNISYYPLTLTTAKQIPFISKAVTSINYGLTEIEIDNSNYSFLKIDQAIIESLCHPNSPASPECLLAELDKTLDCFIDKNEITYAILMDGNICYNNIKNDALNKEFDLVSNGAFFTFGISFF